MKHGTLIIIVLVLFAFGIFNSCIALATLNPIGAQNRTNSRFKKNITKAVEKASKEMINDLPNGSIIAVLGKEAGQMAALNILLSQYQSQSGVKLQSTGDNDTYVTEDLEYQLIKSKKFRIIDRQQINAIRAEQNLQMSGDVDDNTAVSIGKFAGATIVITVNVTAGTSGRITLKALNVQTTEIIAMAIADF
jgi:lipopolysaccharide export LptBFGC system permease protein LptF